MRSFVYYNPNVATVAARDLPGMSRFAQYFKIYNPAVMPLDRSGIVTIPVRVTSLFPLPRFRQFKKDFEAICNDRALELLRAAESRGLPLHVFWSGGIDSTLILVSLLKNATPTQKKNIIVLMTEDSISENPNFYRDHIRGHLRFDSSMLFPYLLDGKHFVSGGEHNDQVFGSDMVASLINRFGPSSIHARYKHETFVEFFAEKTGDKEAAEFFVHLFERVVAAAPIDIETNFEYLWWINFTMKWQSVHMRMLSYVSPRNARKIRPEYVGTLYNHFYNTEEFQLWSMSNLDKRIKDTWPSYKWVCKDIIYEYTKDADYRDTKTKRGSLHFLVTQQIPYAFIDERAQFYAQLDPAEFYLPKNDFV